jgi:hypothetical protein
VELDPVGKELATAGINSLTMRIILLEKNENLLVTDDELRSIPFLHNAMYIMYTLPI